MNKTQTAHLAERLDGIPISALNPVTLSGLRKAMEDVIF
jgi:hypothetical protein